MSNYTHSKNEYCSICFAVICPPHSVVCILCYAFYPLLFAWLVFCSGLSAESPPCAVAIRYCSFRTAENWRFSCLLSNTMRAGSFDAEPNVIPPRRDETLLCCMQHNNIVGRYFVYCCCNSTQNKLSFPASRCVCNPGSAWSHAARMLASFCSLPYGFMLSMWVCVYAHRRRFVFGSAFFDSDILRVYLCVPYGVWSGNTLGVGRSS